MCFHRKAKVRQKNLRFVFKMHIPYPTKKLCKIQGLSMKAWYLLVSFQDHEIYLKFDPNQADYVAVQ